MHVAWPCFLIVWRLACLLKTVGVWLGVRACVRKQRDIEVLLVVDDAVVPEPQPQTSAVELVNLG